MSFNLEQRPNDMRHRVFVKTLLKERWGGTHHRVKLGRRDDLNHREIRQWCAEQPGRFYASDGYEVYYFEDRNTALLFKLRWM